MTMPDALRRAHRACFTSDLTSQSGVSIGGLPIFWAPAMSLAGLIRDDVTPMGGERSLREPSRMPPPGDESIA